MVMGPDIRRWRMASPHAWNDILIVGGEDNLALRELSFHDPRKSPGGSMRLWMPHSTVELRLVMGDRPLDQMRHQPSTRVRPAPSRPRQLGAHLEEMGGFSVARCYARKHLQCSVPTERKS